MALSFAQKLFGIDRGVIPDNFAPLDFQCCGYLFNELQLLSEIASSNGLPKAMSHAAIARQRLNVHR